tara:strand:- start:84 stop:806 length:723 start_codon:yes stop_codon:yes gene_type:complete
MRNEILKYLCLTLILFLFSCAKGDIRIIGEDIIPNPPGKVTLISPANGKTCQTGRSISNLESNVSFSWNPSSDTNTYDILITNLNSNLSTGQSNIYSTSISSTLEKGTPYSWSITSISSKSGVVAKSDTWKFYLAGDGKGNYAPFPAELKAPEPGSILELKDGKATFSWKGADPDKGDTLSYTVYVDKVDGKQTPASALTNLSAQTADVELDAATTYYWRVKTSDGTNASYSIVYSFKTQ